MRKLLLLVAAAAALGYVVRPRPAKADTQLLLAISGLSIEGLKPVCFVRLTNTSPNAGDVYSLHYTVRDTSAGIPLSTPGAGDGAQLAPGKTLVLDLGRVVASYRAGFGVGPFTGPVQFVAFGEGGFGAAFGPGSVQVTVEQHEGAVVRDAPVEWLVQTQ